MGAKISAIMSLPRLAFTDNLFCAFNVFRKLGINLYRQSDVYWEQSASRLLIDRVNAGDDYVIMLDYDSLFDEHHVDELFKGIDINEFDAVFPVQIKRGTSQWMFTPHPGELLNSSASYSRALTGHFGLTIIRCSAIRKIPQPWFWSIPNDDGLWEEGPGRIDADNWFWVVANQIGLKVYQANYVRIGHIELMATWPTRTGMIRKHVTDFVKNGTPLESLDQGAGGQAIAPPPTLDVKGA